MELKKHDILEAVKGEIVGLTNEITFENVSESYQKIDLFFNFMNSLDKLPEFSYSRKLLERITGETKVVVLDSMGESEVVETTIPMPIIPEVATPEQEAMMIVRKLRGAYVPKADAIMSEQQCREMELQDGDYVYLESIEKRDGKSFCSWTFAKKGTGKSNHIEAIGIREEINYGVVSFRDNMMMVEEYITESGRRMTKYNDAPFAFKIRETDLEYWKNIGLELKSGDIVDIAYPIKTPQNCKVIWKHILDEDDIRKEVKRCKKYKEKVKTEKVNPDTNSVLTGKTVVIVGAYNRRSEYEAAFKLCGANCTVIDGDTSRAQTENAVRNSDVVVMFGDIISHDTMWAAKDEAKANDIPFRVIANFGTTMSVRTAIELLSGDEEE
jgi:hypothetical protein